MEGATNKTVRDKFVRRNSINADPFSLTHAAPGNVVIIDLHPFVNNAVIQVNSITGTVTPSLSFDGVNFPESMTAIAATGITKITKPCRYVKLTMSSGGSDVATGLVAGSLE